MWTYNPVLGTRTSLGELPGFVNGIGHNPVDSFIWGKSNNDSVVKIGSNGEWLAYKIPNLPSGILNTGTISSDGYYFLYTTLGARYYTVDLDPSRATYLQLVDPTLGFILDSTAPYGTAISVSLDISDWAYNPVDSVLYGAINVDPLNPSQYYVASLNPKTGVSTVSGPAITGGEFEDSDYGGAYFDADGNFYVLKNTSGHFYRIDLTTHAATIISTYSVTGVEYNDACACLSTPPPNIDLGDAPDTYGSLLNSSGAAHIIDTNLTLGTLIDSEMDGFPNTLANGDDTNSSDNDEEGVALFNVLNTTSTGYEMDVTVYNNTGDVATLAAWIDFNRNGLFDSVERTSAIVPSIGADVITLTWTGITGTVAGQSYVRLRIASDATEVLVPVGTAANGEVEDYGIEILDDPLPVTLFDFKAAQEQGVVRLKWSTVMERNNKSFTVEHSTDSHSWLAIGLVGTQAFNGNSNERIDYIFNDSKPKQGSNYYRLKQTDIDDAVTYSTVRLASFGLTQNINLYPNPAKNSFVLSGLEANSLINIFDVLGRNVKQVFASEASLNLSIEELSTGIYHLKIISKRGNISSIKLIKQ